MVGISLLTLVPGVVGGSGIYARELTAALARVGRLDYRAFVPTIAPGAAGELPAHVVESYAASWSMPGRIMALGRAALWPAPIRSDLCPGSLAALHYPLTVALPSVPDVPAAVTVLDLQHVLLPEFFSRAERLYRDLVYRRSVERAQVVITISEHVKETIVEHLAIEADRVHAIPLGVDLRRFAGGLANRLPMVVYPANAWPHKNHDRLFEAFRIVTRELPELTLVLTGDGADRLQLPDGVEHRGYVSAEELAALYGSAAALVFPSLYEGFGQPVVEAMASGCPVACSRAGALPEVCGEAARYFDPRDPEAIADALLEVLRLADEFIRRGHERSRLFTWEACARRHDDVYEDLITSGRRP